MWKGKEGRREGELHGVLPSVDERKGDRRAGGREGGRERGREGGRARTSSGQEKAVLAMTSAIILARTQVTEMKERRGQRKEGGGKGWRKMDRNAGREGGKHTSRGHRAGLAITSAIMLTRTQVTEIEELGKAFLTTVLSMAYSPYLREPWME